jgi:hypothetical protein
MPPKTETRPPGKGSGLRNEQAGGQVVEDSVRRPSYLMLATLVADSAERERAIFEAAWAAGYRSGFDAGRNVGREQAENEMDAAWAAVAVQIRRLGSTLNRDELDRRRAEPGNLWRFGEGQAAEPDFYTTSLLRRGGVQYTGGPVAAW